MRVLRLTAVLVTALLLFAVMPVSSLSSFPEMSFLPGLLTPVQASADSGASASTYDLVSDLIYTYKMNEVSAWNDIASLLSELKALNPELGSAWEKIMNYWRYINEDITVNPDNLPDGLPQDDSLVIIVLGYMLNSDGSMQEELVHRCETALRCAEKYPEAYIAVTGGGTAFGHPEITEAGVMAEWLEEHGIDRSRIIIEDQSLTTGDNAILTCRILAEQYPEVRHAAIVSSDYHVPLGCLVFQEQFLLMECATGEKAPSVISNAACVTDTQDFKRISEQASYVWKLSETAALY